VIRRELLSIRPSACPQARFVLALLLASLPLVLQGCASSSPMLRVDNIDQIAGQWNGMVTIGQSMNLITVTIKPDRSLTAIWGSITAQGTVTVSNGQASYQMGPPLQEGTFKLYAGTGSTLYMESLDGVFYANLKRQ
jgi:hypothetical protein